MNKKYCLQSVKKKSKNVKNVNTKTCKIVNDVQKKNL